MTVAFCSKILMKSCKQEEKEIREDVHPGLGGDLNLGPPEWQPSVQTTSKKFLLSLYELCLWSHTKVGPIVAKKKQ